jgi:PTS system mannose-specific IIB component
MPIAMVRVDDRLIHGQILEGWLPWTRARELLIPNDSLAEDKIQQVILHAAVPPSTRLFIDTVKKIADQLRDNDQDHVKRMVIVDHPLDALRLRKAGVWFDHLNLGNLRCHDATLTLSPTVMIGEDCVQTLLQILQEGVKVTIQSVPLDEPVDVFHAFRSLYPCDYQRLCPETVGIAL